MENALNDQHIWLVHVGFALLAVSYLVRDMLWLRTIAVCSSMLMITFNMIAYKFPIWGIIGWNVFFISINIYNLIKLIRERANVSFSSDEQWLFDTLFPHLAPHQFRKLCAIAQWQQLDVDAKLVEEGKAVSHMHFLRSGRLTVLAGQTPVATVLPGNFIGEMAYLTGELASADVCVAAPAELVSWPIEALNTLCDADQAIRVALQGVLASDLVDKLRAQSRARTQLGELLDEPLAVS